MSTTAALDIKVIYPLGSRPRSTGRPTRVSARPVLVGGGGAHKLGILSLLVAVLFYYAVWWQVDPFIYRTLIMKTPIPGIDLSRVPSMIKNNPSESATRSEETTTSPSISGMAAAKTIGSVSYAWLALSTVSTLGLAVAAGACLGSRLDPSWKRKWLIILIGGVLGLLWFVYDLATSFGWKYPPDHLRWGIGGLVLFATIVGLAISNYTRALSRMAAVVVVTAAGGSAGGLYLWGQCGAIEGTYQSIPFIIGVFVAHSLYGWLLWPLSARWAR